MSMSSNNRGLPPRPPTPKTTSILSSYTGNKLDESYTRTTSASTPSTPNFTSFHLNNSNNISHFDVKSKPMISPNGKVNKMHHVSSSVRSQSAIRTGSDSTYEVGYETTSFTTSNNGVHVQQFASISSSDQNSNNGMNNNIIGFDDQNQQEEEDQDDLSSSLDPNDPTHNTVLYKTELCRSYQESGFCRYGVKCRFAHGDVDLRPVLRHKKYKTERCKNFERDGYCPYGHRCRFIHNEHHNDNMNMTNMSVNNDDAQSVASSILNTPHHPLPHVIAGSPLLTSLGYPNGNVEPALSLSERLSTSSAIEKSAFLHSPAHTNTTGHNGRNLFDQTVSVSQSHGFDISSYANFQQPFLPPGGSMSGLGAFNSSHSSPFVEPMHHDSMSIDNNMLDSRLRALDLGSGSEKGVPGSIHNDFHFLSHDLTFDESARNSQSLMMGPSFDSLSASNAGQPFMHTSNTNITRNIPGHAKPPLPNYHRNSVAAPNGFMNGTPTNRSSFMESFLSSSSTPSSRHESPMISSIPLNNVDLFRSDSDNALKNNMYPLFRRTSSQDNDQPMLMNVKSAHTLQSDLNLNLAEAFMPSHPQ